MSRPRFWHRVRFKLLLVSLTLLGIPWAGYRFIQRPEHFLRDVQSSPANHGEFGRQHHARSRGGVSWRGAARLGTTYRNLFLHRLDEAPQLDGYRDEWARYDNNFTGAGRSTTHSPGAHLSRPA